MRPLESSLDSNCDSQQFPSLSLGLPEVHLPPGQKPEAKPSASETLEALASRSIKDAAARKAFADDMHTFESRLQTRDGSCAGPFYEQVDKLLDPGATRAKIPQAQRVELAEQLMHHAAVPTAIDQGHHNTCGAAALESEMLTRDPVDSARVIASVALNGCFTSAADKKIIHPHSSLLKPDDEASRNPTPDSWRSFASQIFQAAAISAVFPTYCEIAKRRTLVDSGERVLQKQGSHWVEMPFPGLTADQVQQMNKALSGKNNRLTIIEHARFNPGDGQLHVASEQALKNTIKSLSACHSLPAVIEINTSHEPFFSQIHSSGWHFVTVTNYDDTSSTVSIDNQWGKDSDLSPVSTEETYLAMQNLTPESLAELQRAVLKDRAAGRMDLLLELELIRREKADGLMKPSEYKVHLEAIMFNAKTQWMVQERCGTLDTQARNRTLWQLEYTLRQLPVKDRAEIEDMKLLDLPSQLKKG